MDSFDFSVYNYPDGYLFTDDIMLEIGLSVYPMSTPALIPFSLTYRTCRPADFRIVPVDDRIYYLG